MYFWKMSFTKYYFILAYYENLQLVAKIQGNRNSDFS